MSRNKQDEEAKRRVCDAYREALSRGQDLKQVIGFLAEQENVGRPAIWKRLRAGGILPPYHNSGKGGRPRQIRTVSKCLDGRPHVRPRTIPPAASSRDPCPRCGVRGDIDCGHSKAPLGMTL